MTHTYSIKGMHCEKCVQRVKSALLKLGDIVQADVQLNPPVAVITMSTHISLARLQEAVAGAGAYSLSEGEGPASMEQPDRKASYFPVYLIFGYISMVSTLVLIIRGSFSWMQWMSNFMAGFFLVFSFFKFLNLRGFASTYGRYDLVARYFPAWGYLYPFVELGLAIGFLTGYQPLLILSLTLLLMGIGAIGVINSLRKKQGIRCACLGTVIDLPLGTISLIEDLAMLVMSAWMLWMMY